MAKICIRACFDWGEAANKFLDEETSFYEDLKIVLAAKGKDITQLLADKAYPEILAALLTDEGLDYGNLPKGLLTDIFIFKDASPESFVRPRRSQSPSRRGWSTWIRKSPL